MLRIITSYQMSEYGSKFNQQRTAGASPCFHLPGFHFGYLFLTRSQVMGIMLWTGILLAVATANCVPTKVPFHPAVSAAPWLLLGALGPNGELQNVCNMLRVPTVSWLSNQKEILKGPLFFEGRNLENTQKLHSPSYSPRRRQTYGERSFRRWQAGSWNFLVAVDPELQMVCYSQGPKPVDSVRETRAGLQDGVLRVSGPRQQRKILFISPPRHMFDVFLSDFLGLSNPSRNGPMEIHRGSAGTSIQRRMGEFCLLFGKRVP